MRNFTNLFFKIEGATSSEGKTLALLEYFKSESLQNSAVAVNILSQNTGRGMVTSPVLDSYCLEYFKIPDWLFRECFVHVGDTSEVITLLLENNFLQTETSGQNKSLEFSLEHWMTQEIPSLANLSEKERKDKVFEWWTILSAKEVFILNKLLLGGFNFGVPAKLLTKTLALHNNSNREFNLT